MEYHSLKDRLHDALKSAMTEPDGICVPKFRSMLSSLDRPSRTEMGRLLGEAALGRIAELALWKNAAEFLLWPLVGPWPQDDRDVLVGLKDTFLRELSDPANMAKWTSWYPDPSNPPWHEGPVMAVFLYRILLAVASDDELREPLEQLMKARDEKLRERLRLAHELADGTRLCSTSQITKAEAAQKQIAVFRKRH